jgi:methylase of polypeptide subunit release factors
MKGYRESKLYPGQYFNIHRNFLKYNVKVNETVLIFEKLVSRSVRSGAAVAAALL